MPVTNYPTDLIIADSITYGVVSDPRDLRRVGEGSYGVVSDPSKLVAGGGKIDNFEDQSWSDYNLTVSDDSEFSFVTTPVKNGSYAAQTNYQGSTHKMVSGEGDGLPNYPAQGNTFRMNLYFGSGAFAGYYYGLQDQYNKYLIRPNSGNSSFELYKEEGEGNFTLLAEQTSVTVPTGEWMEIEVDWQPTTTCTLFDASGTQLAQISTTDSTFTSGGFGFESNSSNSSATITFDYARIV